MILSTDTVVQNESEEQYKTYKIFNNKIQGHVSGIDAVAQSIKKELDTQVMEHDIYSLEYGIDIESLIAKDRIYVELELRRRIQECLEKDNRIVSIDKITVSYKEDVLTFDIDVITVYGDLTIVKEVSV